MTIRRIHILILIFSLIAIKAKAQSKFIDDLELMINLHTGYNIPEYSMFTYLTEDYIHSVDLSIIKSTTGKNQWEQIFKYPQYGLSLFYSSLGNDDVFGREISTNLFFKVNLIYKEKFKLYNQLGVGLGYVNKVFDLNDNYMNVAVGSHVNLHFNYRLGCNFEFIKKTKINLGISFDHFSNANTSEPNLGINYLTAFAGLSYTIGRISDKQIQIIKPHIKKNNFEIIYNLGLKNSRALKAQKYFTSSLSFEVKRESFRAFYLGLGLDLFYDSSVRDQLISAEKDYNTFDSFQTGIHFSQTLVYNKLSLTIQEGVYMLLTEKVGEHIMYNRGIIRYQVNKKFSVRLSMKSHLHILDYPEFGIGYKL